MEAEGKAHVASPEQTPVGRKRKNKTPAHIAARLGRVIADCLPVAAEGTVQLNKGFFTLENMRKGDAVKSATKVKPALRGTR